MSVNYLAVELLEPEELDHEAVLVLIHTLRLTSFRWAPNKQRFVWIHHELGSKFATMRMPQKSRRSGLSDPPIARAAEPIETRFHRPVVPVWTVIGDVPWSEKEGLAYDCPIIPIIKE
jgi:hypothetical protein